MISQEIIEIINKHGPLVFLRNIMQKKTELVFKLLLPEDLALSQKATAFATHLILCHVQKKPNTYWYKFGYTYLGYSCLGFIRYLIKELSNRPVDKVYFMLREGYIFKIVYDMLRTPDLPESDLLFSRRKLALEKDPGYMEYLADHIKGKVAMVDIGWSGSTQDLIQRNIPNCDLMGYYMGTVCTEADSKRGVRDLINNKIKGYLFQDRTKHPDPLVFFEAIFLAPCPLRSIEKISKSNGEYEMEYNPISFKLPEFYCNEIVNGTKDFINDFLSIDEKVRGWPGEYDVFYILDRLIQKPTYEEFINLGTIWFDPEEKTKRDNCPLFLFWLLNKINPREIKFY